jgi:hypothetical protein
MGSPQKQKPSFKRTKKKPIVSVESSSKAPEPSEPPIPAPPETTQVLDNDKQERVHAIDTITRQLQEKEPSARAQITMIVKRLGITEATAICEQALSIEAQGGMVLPDGSRRRTVGGVFFYLVKQQHPELFRWQRATKEGEPGRTTRQTAPAPLSLMKWEERITALDEIGIEKGTITTVKITLIGRPGKIVSRGSCIVTSMRAKQDVPSLPKGLPTPPAYQTTYTLYIAMKQWNKVAEAIRDPEDTLIVEGFPQLDPETSCIAVFATNTTTKKLQQAQRQAQQAAQ